MTRVTSNLIRFPVIPRSHTWVDSVDLPADFWVDFDPSPSHRRSSKDNDLWQKQDDSPCVCNGWKDLKIWIFYPCFICSMVQWNMLLQCITTPRKLTWLAGISTISNIFEKHLHSCLSLPLSILVFGAFQWNSHVLLPHLQWCADQGPQGNPTPAEPTREVKVNENHWNRRFFC